MIEQHVSATQLKVLKVLANRFDTDDMSCAYLATIAKEAKMERRLARIAVRALARKGLAKLERGLIKLGAEWELAGSGYCATREGVNFVADIKERHAA